MEIVIIIIVIVLIVVVVMAATPTPYGRAINQESGMRAEFQRQKEEHEPTFKRGLSELCAKYGCITTDIDIYPRLPFESEFSGTIPYKLGEHQTIVISQPSYVIKSTKTEEEFYIPFTSMSFEFESINNKIIVFEEKTTIVIQEKSYKFADIVTFEVFDNSMSIYSGTTTTTKSGSMFGRAAVGGLLFGGAGAIIGGTTAKQETTGQTETTIHNYDVVLTLNSLSTPMLKVNFGENQQGVQKFVSILSIILERRNK